MLPGGPCCSENLQLELIQDLHTEEEDSQWRENEAISIPPVWEHAITNLLGYGPESMTGLNLRKWVLHQQFTNDLEEFAAWEASYFKLHGDALDRGTMVFSEQPNTQLLRRNQAKQLRGLWCYIAHFYLHEGLGLEGYVPSLRPDNWTCLSASDLRIWLINFHRETLKSERVRSTSSSWNTSLGLFQKGITQGVSAYPALQNDKYYNSFIRLKIYNSNAWSSPSTPRHVNNDTGHTGDPCHHTNEESPCLSDSPTMKQASPSLSNSPTMSPDVDEE